MITTTEHQELTRTLAKDWAKDLLPSFPLVTTHIQSKTIIDVLRQSANAILASAEESLKVRLCLVAFGSLGRSEFVLNASDLDPIILVDGDLNPRSVNEIRSAILSPLAEVNPWLPLDERDKVLARDWENVSAPEIRFPVLSTHELTAGVERLTMQRRWQILLEGRPLWNERLFNEIYAMLLPQIRRPRSRFRDSPGTSETEIDFRSLVRGGADFFGGFEDPAFLYKSAFKYWKTRFLREGFVFASQLLFVLGSYLQTDGERLSQHYIRAATYTKLVRCVRFAQELENACSQNPALNKIYTKRVNEIIKPLDIPQERVLLYGTDEAYSTLPARLLHGLILNILTRFTRCWEKIYDPNVRGLLDTLPKHNNPDSLFEQEIQDPETRSTVRELKELRRGYHRYMKATAKVVDEVFVNGRVWTKHTGPREIQGALKPFENL